MAINLMVGDGTSGQYTKGKDGPKGGQNRNLLIQRPKDMMFGVNVDAINFYGLE